MDRVNSVADLNSRIKRVDARTHTRAHIQSHLASVMVGASTITYEDMSVSSVSEFSPTLDSDSSSVQSVVLRSEIIIVRMV